jgi:cysteinyl-tRNA synthetase
VQERERARAQKDYERADEIRERIKSLGFYVEDTPNGPVVRKKRII